jgi:hypothetical protein
MHLHRLGDDPYAGLGNSVVQNAAAYVVGVYDYIVTAASSASSVTATAAAAAVG